MRDDPALAATYVILLTGRSTRGDLIAGLDAGADDYMFKPIDTDELRARVQTGIRIATLQQRLTERVSELQTARDHLTRLASIDTLTDVYTRRWWFDMAGTELSRCVRYDHPLSVLLLDLDHFKRVNDTWGHHNGDNLLRAFADMLRAECRQSDIVGRLGGEEFAIVAAETPAAPAQALAARIGRACRRISVPTAHGSIACSCSIGLSELRPGDRTVDEILRRADGALYAAKRAGRDCWKCDADEPAEVVW
jgi:diguanylate cyclase (GGDEF)-like protein